MTQTTLKLIARAVMLADHIGEFIPGRPLLLRLIGRISAPVFVFCAVQGALHTRDRIKYLKRLYLWGVFMGAMDFFLNSLLPVLGRPCDNNIFPSLFLIVLFIHIWEKYKENSAGYTGQNRYISPADADAGRKRDRILSLIGFFIIPAVLRMGLIFRETALSPLPVYNILDALLPNIITCEGSIAVVAMGVVLYQCKKDRKTLTLGYIAYCGVYLATVLCRYFSSGRRVWLPVSDWLFIYNYQWLQILALPFIICYNGRRGKGYSRFFYIFYPLHIGIFAVTGYFLTF